MSASALSLTTHLSVDVDSRQESVEPNPCCRFCKCDPNRPCEISIHEDRDGTFRLARTPEETTEVVNCVEFLPGICNAPECMAKLRRELLDATADVRTVFRRAGS